MFSKLKIKLPDIRGLPPFYADFNEHEPIDLQVSEFGNMIILVYYLVFLVTVIFKLTTTTVNCHFFINVQQFCLYAVSDESLYFTISNHNRKCYIAQKQIKNTDKYIDLSNNHITVLTKSFCYCHISQYGNHRNHYDT